MPGAKVHETKELDIEELGRVPDTMDSDAGSAV
jgi:hypothetical protein